ncbi:hypothetical protein GETHLI_01610 [Geothrix limicola]|uniref:DUF948 domain-containing protein n=1 Tax=Geothrix limicola TaxID=2927978 RepID=A0ABQ5QAS8_9BACT|nr:DUF948 domain-containing protein [Geothrix limicola]GLH71659.1 hypothetical protein GETHLI_01610 [Geothrix limicola]
MTMALQIILGLAILAVVAFLIPFLFQARRTALALERLAERSSQDLDRIAEDIHAVRTEVEGLTQRVAHNLDHPSGLAQIVISLMQVSSALTGGHERRPNILEALLTGLRSVLHLFRRQRAAAKEGPHE